MRNKPKFKIGEWVKDKDRGFVGEIIGMFWRDIGGGWVYWVRGVLDGCEYSLDCDEDHLVPATEEEMKRVKRERLKGKLEFWIPI
jgi:hypothetical protein